MSRLDYPLKDGQQLAILNFEDCRQTEIHAEGCKHAAKASRVSPVTPGKEPHEKDGYGDDWYHVAPCARPRGAKKLDTTAYH